jgi:VWFA-related protein
MGFDLGLRPTRATAATLAFIVVAASTGRLTHAGFHPAQASERQSSQRPTFRTAANFVLVDVHATVDGRPAADLNAEDFEVLEDGVPQAIALFEHVQRRPARDASRAEPQPGSGAGVLPPAAESRAFVLFLDTPHVSLGAAYRAKGPVARVLDRVMAPDDFVAAMTPEMSPGELGFTRRGESVRALLDRWWAWARRDYRSMSGLDAREKMYAACYPPTAPNRSLSEIAAAMIERRREKLTLDALASLVSNLPGLQDGRKAVLVVTEGWRLFRADRGLGATGGAPQPPGVHAGPAGKVAVGTDPRTGNAAQLECDRDREELAQLDNAREFRRLLDAANRANVSFYAIDPRGLPVFDADLGPDAPLMPQDPKASILAADQDALRSRIESIQTLAETTDGLSVVNRADLDVAVSRIAEDMNAYYLLGYYSSAAKPDGKFHSITVRVKRPGVSVRARRGYRSPTAEEVAARDAASNARPATRTPAAAAVAALGTVRPDAPVRVRAGCAWAAEPHALGGQQRPFVWVVTEIDRAQSQRDAWKQGAAVRIALVDADGRAVGEGAGEAPAASRSLLTRLEPAVPLAPGEYRVRVRVEARGAPASTLDETVRVTVPDVSRPRDPAGLPALLFRRGPFGGPGYVPTADPRFRREERIRVELPVHRVAAFASALPSARLLDRAGRALAVPVAAFSGGEAGDSSLVAELALAPLAPGDYLIELTTGDPALEGPYLVAFRVVP